VSTQPQAQKPFRDYKDFALVCFFVFANYFALIGLWYAKKAGREFHAGQLDAARRHAKRARAWALYGIIPSTVINAAIIYGFCLLIWNLFLKEIWTRAFG